MCIVLRIGGVLRNREAGVQREIDGILDQIKLAIERATPNVKVANSRSMKRGDAAPVGS